MPPLIVSIHGIRTRGAWQKELTAELNRAGFIHEPLDFGFFRAIRLLWPPARQRQITWFLEQYSLVADRSDGSPISVIAHSFGSYLVARSLERFPEVTFERVILCGSIVRRDYPWTRIIHQSRQVQEVLNDYGRLDLWAGIAGWLMSDAGPSGRNGFIDDAHGKVVQRDHQEFSHSDYFYRLNYQKNWIPFLLGDGPGPISRHDRRPANWRFKTTVIIATLLLLSLSSLVWNRLGPPSRRVCDETLQRAVNAYTHDRTPEASRLFREAASCDSDLATMWTAHLYFRGLLDFEKSTEKANALAGSVIERVKQQADAGSAEAQFLLGSAYLYGMGVQKNTSEALKLLQVSAEQEYSLAQYTLAILLDRGVDVEHNAVESDRQLKRAAANGVPQAATELAEREKKSKNYAAALQWYRKAVESGNSNALVAVGNMLEAGLGEGPDRCRACQSYELAAKSKNSDGQANLGLCYLIGVAGCSVDGEVKFQKDCREARRQLEASVSSNPPSLPGLYNLGISLIDLRDDCPQQFDDVAQGLQYIERAALGKYDPAIEFLERSRKAPAPDSRR